MTKSKVQVVKCCSKCHRPFLNEKAPYNSPRAERNSLIMKIAAIALSTVLAIGGAASYVHSSSNDVRKEAIAHTDQTKKDIESHAEKKYSGREQVGRIEESLKNQKDDIGEIKKEQKNISKKIDTIVNHLIK